MLYKSWCHNPVSTFALCLMAQYYEHAVALLQSLQVIPNDVLSMKEKKSKKTWRWHVRRRFLFFLSLLSAEFEITVNLLIQVDKLVQLIESPVFTCKVHMEWEERGVKKVPLLYVLYVLNKVSLFFFLDLRLQLLEPERYPHLFKCLYGLLMLLPQSTAFATLRNRLTSVSSMGFIHLVPKT